MLKAAFITTEREHLVQLSKMLSAAIPEVLLDNPEKPVAVSVRGGVCTGKKIITDVAVDHFLGGTPQRAGHEGFDEYVTGMRAEGAPMEIDYVDMAAQYGHERVPPMPGIMDYMERLAWWRGLPPLEDRLGVFLAQRQKGGITFVQNSRAYAAQHAWIDLWIEKPRQLGVEGLPETGLHRAPKSLARAFNRMAQDKPDMKWLRYVRVTSDHPALLASKSFRAAIELLQAAAGPVSSKHDPVIRPVGIFGRNIPQAVMPC